MTTLATSLPGERRASKSGARWKRLGFAGFLFFAIKGLLWLLVPAWLWLGP